MRYAAFLRAINVGGRKATKADLTEPFEALGFGEVSTYRASGNVLFDAGSRKPSRKRIEKALADAFGFEVTTFLRSASQLDAIAAATPFSKKQISSSNGKLQVVFLEREPAKSAKSGVDDCATSDDLLTLSGSELYWLPNLGVGRSELKWKDLEKALGAQSATVRTMGTVERIAAKLGS